jgi:hypothetical protein
MSNKFFMQTFGALEWDPEALIDYVEPDYEGEETNIEEKEQRDALAP